MPVRVLAKIKDEKNIKSTQDAMLEPETFGRAFSGLWSSLRSRTCLPENTCWSSRRNLACVAQRTTVGPVTIRRRERRVRDDINTEARLIEPEKRESASPC